MKNKTLVLKSGVVSEVGKDDLLTSNNFSYYEIESTDYVYVPFGQQMLINDRVRVDGKLRVVGQVYVFKLPTPEPFPELPGDNFGFYQITDSREIKQNQEMVLSEFCKISGQLKISGRMAVLSKESVSTDDGSIPNYIQSQETFKIGLHFEKYFRNFLKVAGQLKCSGSFVVGV